MSENKPLPPCYRDDHAKAIVGLVNLNSYALSPLSRSSLAFLGRTREPRFRQTSD